MCAISRPHVPVNMGSPRFQSAEVNGLRITRAWFPPKLLLSPHHHDRACFAVVLEGSLNCTIANRTYDCASDTVWVEPAGERHQNRFDEAGASVVVLQPDSEREELLRPCAALLNEVSSFQHAGIIGLARTLVREMQLSDNLTPLALEASGLEMLVMGSRARKDHRKSSQPPGWLLRVEEIVHDRFRDPLRVSQIAREVGVHPVHLGRVFRQHKHVPIASYVRGLRLEWAAGQLQTTDDSLSAIALRSGFSDQSHFTRAFKQHTGHPPGRFRVLTKN